ncbi:hypothetical protein ACFQ2B_34595 [Streptomyces stramineus]
MGLGTAGTGTGPVSVRRGVPAGAERRAAELYWDAFGRKLGPALNPPDKAVSFLADHLNADRAVCALLDGQLVGLAGYQLGGRAFTGARPPPCCVRTGTCEGCTASSSSPCSNAARTPDSSSWTASPWPRAYAAAASGACSSRKWPP